METETEMETESNSNQSEAEKKNNFLEKVKSITKVSDLFEIEEIKEVLDQNIQLRKDLIEAEDELFWCNLR